MVNVMKIEHMQNHCQIYVAPLQNLIAHLFLITTRTLSRMHTTQDTQWLDEVKP